MPLRSAQSCPTLCNPMDPMLPTRLLCPWDFSKQEYWSGLPFPYIYIYVNSLIFGDIEDSEYFFKDKIIALFDF